MDEDDVRRLFARKPRQWGLRGDPYAWEAMRIGVQAAERPPDADALLILLHDVFYRRVGVELRADDTPDSVYVPEFAHGGMSSGYVDVRTWRERLMPILAERARRLYPR
jgi:hypothetical protein